MIIGIHDSQVWYHAVSTLRRITEVMKFSLTVFPQEVRDEAAIDGQLWYSIQGVHP